MNNEQIIALYKQYVMSTYAPSISLVRGRAITEASGKVSLDSVAAIAASGVEIISVGRLTHSAPALDLALDFNG